MAGSEVVLGYLKYVLGFDSVAFEKGAGEAEKRLKATERHFKAVGDRMQSIGGKLSAGITAPVLAIGTAFAASAREMAASAPELQAMAQLANTSTSQFQRLAYAAKSVGVESDKLSDIYKDVNDKVGDFMATGGGEMKDFFEKIAPKVGVTAAQFKRLSGPDALQLYVSSLEKAGVSQAEMTFYMEAIADDATRLLPLLRDNGKAMGDLGKNAAVISPEQLENMKRYTAAQQQMQESFRALTIAVVDSGLLETLTNLATKVAEWTKWVAKAHPEAFKLAAAIGGVSAAVGPVVFGVGSMVKMFSPLLARLAPLIGTAGAAATGAGGTGLVGIAGALGPIAIGAIAVVAAYKNWDKIGPWIDNVATRMQDWATKTDANIKQFTDGVNAMDRRLGIPSQPEFLDSIERNFTESVARIDAWLLGVQKWAADFDAAFVRMASSAVTSMQRLYTGVKTWLGDKLNAIWASAAEKIQWINDKFFGLYDAVVGHSYIPDMVDEIGQHMRRLDQEMVAPATGAISKTDQAFRALAASLSPILDRLYPAEARENRLAADIETVNAAVKAGILPAQQAAEAIKRLRDEYARELGGKPTAADVIGEPNDEDLGLPDVGDIEIKVGDIEEVLGGLGKANDDAAASFEDMARRAMYSLQSLVGAIKGGDFVDILSSIADAFFSLGGAGLFGKSNGKTFDFGGFRAEGGPVGAGRTYMVGERGPELFTATRSGYIHPNPSNDNGSAQFMRVAIDVNEGPMFRATIRDEANTQATAVSIDSKRRDMKSYRNTMGRGTR
ncbi:hypothetical protein [Sphingomonas hankookensis]|uniref:Tail tape measure protein n=1 Tax=Sphingomonas hankookensis TaxID=563996 RepID=A0ABR5YDG5_9SPHN|nr:hypothetical protein [Sphingomonas hankookensis]KZE16228.1 hypothetical protein AVT10_12060 [Sphingomonas hankookensis]